ncbi:MAG: hypothetical protein CMJ62_07955 [Planctomycetaceae bacterium]|nr:hypothetical protein [Planctomycetaceae bacterium]
MNNESRSTTLKVHPASREVLPEDPMDLCGFEVPGDPDLMLRILVEDYARMGWDTEAIMNLANDPNYRVFHGLLQMFGKDEMRQRVADVIGRCGVMRVKTMERESPLQIVQVDLPTAK